MPPSTDSSTSSSTSSSEPRTPPFTRNASWTPSRTVATPDRPSSSTATTNGWATPSSIRKRFASLTRSGGKSAAGTLSAGATPLSTTPLDECTQRIEKLDLYKGSAGTSTPKMPVHAPSAPVSRRASFSKSNDDVFSTPHTKAEDIDDDSPLQRLLKSPNAVSFPGRQAYRYKQGRVAEDSHVDPPCTLFCRVQQPLPGHPGNLTDAQKKALHELITLLKEDGALHGPDAEPPSYQETQLL